jgi:hypothetical protein
MPGAPLAWKPSCGGVHGSCKYLSFWGVSQNSISVDHEMLHFDCFGRFHVGEYMEASILGARSCNVEILDVHQGNSDHE